MIKFEKISAGQILFDVRKAVGRHAWSGRKHMTWPVYVRSVDAEKRTVVASWNGNPDVTMSERRITSFRANRPTPKPTDATRAG